MTTFGQEVRKSTASSSSSDWTLDELRESVASIADDLKKVAERRGQYVKEQAQGGVIALRKSIRRQPALAIAIATAAGAALAVLAVPRFGAGFLPLGRLDAIDAVRHPRRPFRSTPWAMLWAVLSSADKMQRSAMRTANLTPLASSLERLVEAVSKLEPSA